MDEAIEIFKKLERSNPRDINRKASLALSYIEKRDFETAQKYSAEAEQLDPGSSRVVEIKAQVLLCQGNNAVLACRRLGEFDMALKYVARCAKEYGSLFQKLAKIKETLESERAQKAKATAINPPPKQVG